MNSKKQHASLFDRSGENYTATRHKRLKNDCQLKTVTDEVRTKTIIEYSSDVVTVLDPDGIINYESPSITDLAGYLPDEVIGRNAFDLIHPSDHKAVMAAISEGLVNPQTRPRVRYRWLHKDGHWVDVESIGVNLLDDPSVKGFLINTRDISQLKSAEKSLAQAHANALKASRLKSEFMSSISHEVRTPMHGLFGALELLDDTELTADQEKLLGIMRSSTDGLMKLVNDLLDFSKLQTGELKLQREEFDLVELAYGVVSLNRPGALLKQLQVAVDLGQDLKAAAFGDARRLRQSLMGIFENAVKFTDSGSVKLRVTQQPVDDGMRTLFEVIDTGIGLYEHELEEIFEPLTQADGSLTRRHGGSGLGLSIAQRWVKMMGGKIQVESEPGVGSRFYFSLDLSPAVEQSNSARQPVTEELSDIEQDSLIKEVFASVLVVEDNVVNCEVLKRQLAKIGINADIVMNGLEALKASQTKSYDLILMDCQMPEMDGITATREIRKTESSDKKATIIALTANSMEGSREQCLSAGMDNFLNKPVTLKQLRATLRGQIANSGVGGDNSMSSDTPRYTYIEKDVIENLIDELDGDKDTVKSLIDLYLQKLPERLASLEAAIAADDLNEMAMVAHSLKSASATFGVGGLSTLCAELERIGKSAEGSGKSLNGQLREQADGAVKELEGYLLEI